MILISITILKHLNTPFSYYNYLPIFNNLRLKVGQITSDTTAKLFQNACAAPENSDEDFEGSNEDKRKIQIDVLKHFELMVILLLLS